MDTVGYMAKAKAKKVTDRFVSRTTRLAYLSPEVLERLVIRREPHALSWNDLVGATYLPWARQTERVFEGKHTQNRLDPSGPLASGST